MQISQQRVVRLGQNDFDVKAKKELLTVDAILSLFNWLLVPQIDIVIGGDLARQSEISKMIYFRIIILYLSAIFKQLKSTLNEDGFNPAFCRNVSRIYPSFTSRWFRKDPRGRFSDISPGKHPPQTPLSHFLFLFYNTISSELLQCMQNKLTQ